MNPSPSPAPLPPAKPLSPGVIVFSVFAALCLFAAVASFLTGFGQISAGANHIHTNQAQAQGAFRTGDDIQNDANREIAENDDNEEAAHRQFNLIVGGLLLLPAVVLGVMSKRRNG